MTGVSLYCFISITWVIHGINYFVSKGFVYI